MDAQGDDDDTPKKTPTAVIVRRVLVLILALACAGALLYTRVLAKKSTLGGPCSFDMHCKADAPRCMKASAEGDGVCSRPCEVGGGDCAEGIACVKVGLEERDERGVPLEGGYCVPQAVLDARKKKPAVASAPPSSWIDVPHVPGQLEGEVVIRRAHGKGAPVEVAYLVKGSLVRTKEGGAQRTIVDTSSMRVIVVDDAKKTFAGAALTAPQAEVRLDKTSEKREIAGRACDVWRLGEGREAREVCVAPGGAFLDPASRAVSPWARELAVRGVFPLRVVETGRPGHEGVALEVARFDARPLDDALFEVPKSYRNLAGR